MSLRASVAPLCAALALTAAGCGSSAPASDPLSATQSHLQDIHSGVLTLVFTARAGSGEDVGFRLRGAFQTGDTPARADLTYTQVAGSATDTATVSVSGGSGTLVHGASTTAVAVPAGSGAIGGGLDGLHLAVWLHQPVVGEGGQADGVAVDRITGEVDVAAAIADLAALVSHSGGQAPSLPDAGQLASVTRSASVEVLSGHDDHLLRHLTLDVALAAPPSPAPPTSLPGAASLHVEVGVERVNQAVLVGR